MSLLEIIMLFVVLPLSVVLNIVMRWYIKTSIDRFHLVSEEVSEIFTMLDAYKEHLNSVYEMPTFYGDPTLQNLLEHSKEMVEYIKQYEEVYSFSQPDLEEQLLEASKEYEEYEEEETPTKKQ